MYPITILCSRLYYKYRSMSLVIFQCDVFNNQFQYLISLTFFIRCMGLNVAYINPFSLHHTVRLPCHWFNTVLSKMMPYMVLYILGIMIIDYDYISSLIVVVNTFIIFLDIVFINLCLILLMYSFPIHYMFYL